MSECLDYGRPGQWRELQRSPIQVRAREPAGLLPRHAESIRASVARIHAIVDDRDRVEIVGIEEIKKLTQDIDDILNLYPVPFGYSYVNPLDYLELTARAA